MNFDGVTERGSLLQRFSDEKLLFLYSPLGICRMSFDGCPPDAKYPGDDSPVVWGQCAHAFHLQCINKWCDRPAGPPVEKPLSPLHTLLDLMSHAAG